MADMDEHFKEAERQFESQYELLDNSQIGEGTYGKVYKARSRRTGECVALKRVMLDPTDEDRDWQLREAQLQQKLVHPNIVPLLEVFCKPSRLTMVFEYLEMDLRQYMRSLHNNLAPPVVRHLARQLVCGVAFCHDRRVLHRDIKPANLLVNQQGLRLKLGDFGLARVHEVPHRVYTQEVVTTWYRAPELLMGSEVYGFPVDIWSVGCVIAEMATGMPLFPGNSEIGTIFKVFEMLGSPTEGERMSHLPNFKSTFPRWRHQGWRNIRNTLSQVGESGIDFLERVMVYDPTTRLVAKAALKHEYFIDAFVLQDKIRRKAREVQETRRELEERTEELQRLRELLEERTEELQRFSLNYKQQPQQQQQQQQQRQQQQQQQRAQQQRKQQQQQK